MPDSSNTPELYERVVKIKELPMKESVTPDSVLLIEDDEDTKQMPVTVFYDLIDNISKQALNMVRAKLEELDSYLENSGLDGIADLIKQIEEAEKARVEAEKEREANEQDRESTFNGWKNTFDKTWKPAIEDAIKQEAVRQSNETYRTDKFNEWLNMINQWELAEQERSDAETEREKAEQWMGENNYNGSVEDVINAKADLYEAGVTDDKLMEDAMKTEFKNTGSLSSGSHQQYVDAAAFIKKQNYTKFIRSHEIRF